MDCEKTEQIIIVGLGEIAEMAKEYFTSDSSYSVVAFAGEENYITEDSFMGLPVVRFETLEKTHPANRYKIFVAIGYNRLNRGRGRLYLQIKAKGYELVSYVSSRAFIGENVTIGDNCFILENNVIQREVVIGNDVTLWSGNHLGHRSHIGDHCFVSSHVAISGYCTIGTSCFMGINSCTADHVDIGNDCVIGAGAVLLSDAESGKIYRGNPAQAARISSYHAFGIKAEE